MEIIHNSAQVNRRFHVLLLLMTVRKRINKDIAFLLKVSTLKQYPWKEMKTLDGSMRAYLIRILKGILKQQLIKPSRFLLSWEIVVYQMGVVGLTIHDSHYLYDPLFRPPELIFHSSPTRPLKPKYPRRIIRKKPHGPSILRIMVYTPDCKRMKFLWK